MTARHDEHGTTTEKEGSFAMAKPDEFIDAWRKICSRAWGDENFKQRLVANPGEVLAEEGLEAPPGVSYKVVENQPNELNLVLPAPPQDVERLVGAGHATVDRYYAAAF